MLHQVDIIGTWNYYFEKNDNLVGYNTLSALYVVGICLSGNYSFKGDKK